MSNTHTLKTISFVTVLFLNYDRPLVLRLFCGLMSASLLIFVACEPGTPSAPEAVGKGLASYESIKKFILLDQPFSIESGELTPSLKVKRKVVEENYKEEINFM